MGNVGIIESFESKRPICVMAQLALDRLLSREALDELFDDVAQQQYHRSLLFSSLAQLMASVVLCRQKSVNAAYKRRKDELGASLNAVYTKLERMETGLSQAVVRYSYAQVTAVSNELHAYDVSYVTGYKPKILDGNHLAGTERRLLETRNSTAAPLPGKCLVVLDPRREAIADLFPIEDGHAQERSALDEVIETIERQDLWIADRNFCTLKLMYAIDGRGAKFVIRKHQQLKGQAIGPRRYMGKTDTGRVYEQKLELPTYDGRTLVVRQIEIELLKKTRDGDARIVILTNLTEEEADAIKVTQIYRKRWTLETAFHKLTTTLRCEINTLCYPKAALFAFSLACLAYNAVAVVMASIIAQHGRQKAEQMSFHYMSEEIAQTYDGMMIAIPESYWTKVRTLSTTDFAQHMREVSRHIDFEYFRKSKRGPKKPKPKLKHRKRKVHVSTAQILARRKQ
jgi:IS4 transposase